MAKVWEWLWEESTNSLHSALWQSLICGRGIPRLCVYVWHTHFTHFREGIVSLTCWCYLTAPWTTLWCSGRVPWLSRARGRSFLSDLGDLPPCAVVAQNSFSPTMINSWGIFMLSMLLTNTVVVQSSLSKKRNQNWSVFRKKLAFEWNRNQTLRLRKRGDICHYLSETVQRCIPRQWRPVGFDVVWSCLHWGKNKKWVHSVTMVKHPF